MNQNRFLRSHPHLAEYNSNLYVEVGVVPATRRAKKKSLWRDERQMAASIVKHIEERAIRNSLYSLILHVPNENAHHNPGVKGGFPDFFWPVAKRGFHGLAVEIKTADGIVSNDQRWWLASLEDQGYMAVAIFESQDEILALFDWYVE